MTSRTKSKLYTDMLAKFGANGMAKPMTFGEACDIFGAIQEGEIKALKSLMQRLTLIEKRAGYTVTGTDKSGKPIVRALTR